MTLLKSLTNYYQKWSNFKLKIFLYKKATACRFHMHNISQELVYKIRLVEKFIGVFPSCNTNIIPLNSWQQQLPRIFFFYWQASLVISGHYIKRNLANRSFHLVNYGNLTKTVYILCSYTPVGWNFNKVVPFEVGWSDIW